MGDVTKIRELVSKTYREMVVNHDAAGYASMYSDQVLWCPPNAPDQTTRAGIAKHMQGAFDKVVFNVEPSADEVEVMGDVAYAAGMVYGRTTPRAGGDDNAVKFRIFWLLRKESGDWKIHRQIWNNKP